MMCRFLHASARWYFRLVKYASALYESISAAFDIWQTIGLKRRNTGSLQ